MSAVQNLHPGQTGADTHPSGAGVDPSAPEATDTATPNPAAPRVHGSLAEATLRILAENHTDFERTRIATENRLRSMQQVYGIEEGIDLPEIVRLQVSVDAAKALEHAAELDLRRALRAHPLGGWVKRTIGIGEKQSARLIAAIGDPYWNTLHDRPRTVSELWAYCGYHVLHPGHNRFDAHRAVVGVDPSSNPGHTISGDQVRGAGVAPSRRKGQRANWNADAKMRAFLCAESCIKQAASPYRAVYDLGRHKYATAVHAGECRRCGPAGKPAPSGSPLSAGHQHARALRLVAKAILRDLWLEARS